MSNRIYIHFTNVSLSIYYNYTFIILFDVKHMNILTPYNMQAYFPLRESQVNKYELFVDYMLLHLYNGVII